MPGVVRQQKPAALALLDKDGLHADVVEAYDATVPAGQVIGTSPDPATHVLRGGTVEVTVSKGPPPVPVPDQTGQTQGAAASRLQGLGFQVKIAPDKVFSETVPDGSVTAEAPTGSAQPGSVITLTISRGAEQFQVPDVTGMSPGDATAKLAQQGFTNVTVSKGLINSGAVQSQDPTAGSYARHKDQITLYLSIFS
jgi:serine/threonine-protein kinase